MRLYFETLTPELVDKIQPIIEENWNETGHFDKLDIFWEMYLAADASVFLLEDSEELVGILMFYVGPYPHDKNTTYAEQLTFYIREGYRKYSTDMMEFAETILEEFEVKLVIQSAPPGSRFGNNLPERGYSPLETRFYKRLS